MRTGVERIAAERERQIHGKHWTVEHDRTEHADGSLTDAATALLLEYHEGPESEDVLDRSPPWVRELTYYAGGKYKGQQRFRILEIAGALIAAELDRLNPNAP